MKWITAILKGSMLLVVLAGVAMFVFLFSFKTVDSGEVAVVTRFGQVTGLVLYQEQIL